MPAEQTTRRLFMALAILCIALQFGGSLPFSALALGIWMLAMARYAPTVLKTLWLPRFWTITLLFALASGLLLGKRDITVLSLRFSRMGLEGGLLMIIRGAFIFALVSWASRTLSGEGLQRFFGLVGAGRLGTSAAMALTLLPDLKDRWREASAAPGGTRGRGRLRKGYLAAVQMLVQTARLADEMAIKRSNPGRGNCGPGPLLGAVVSPPGGGKTTVLAAIAERLQAHGLSVGGVVQPKILEAGVQRGYRLRDVATGEERLFAEIVGKGDTVEESYAFHEDGWHWARAHILDARRSAQVVVVDELGLLEGRGEGHSRALLDPLTDERGRVWLLGVRGWCAESIQRQLGRFARTLPAEASEDKREEFIRWVLAQTLSGEQQGDTRHCQDGAQDSAEAYPLLPDDPYRRDDEHRC